MPKLTLRIWNSATSDLLIILKNDCARILCLMTVDSVTIIANGFDGVETNWPGHAGFDSNFCCCLDGAGNLWHAKIAFIYFTTTDCTWLFHQNFMISDLIGILAVASVALKIDDHERFHLVFFFLIKINCKCSIYCS